jgi:hypothetical protein
MLALLDGDPGLGKSTLLADLIARLTRGRPMPDETSTTRVPQSVLMLSAEDDVARVVRPRLEAAGADLGRVHFFESMVRANDERPPSLPDDLLALEPWLRAQQIGLITVDPLMAYLSRSVDANRDQDVRRALHRMKRQAERLDAALWIVRHLNKMAAMQALYRGGGSIGIVGAARTALAVGYDPEDISVRVLAMNKSNLGPVPRSLRYRIETLDSGSRVQWLGECDLTAAEVLRGPRKPEETRADTESASQVDACAQLLRELLAEGPVPVKDIETAALQTGYSDSTLRRARQRLPIRVRKEFGQFGAWTWQLKE